MVFQQQDVQMDTPQNKTSFEINSQGCSQKVTQLISFLQNHGHNSDLDVTKMNGGVRYY